MNSPRDVLPLFTGVVFSLLGLAFAWWSYASFMTADDGKTLICAGAAIAFGTMPLSRLSKRDLFKSMNELAADAVRKPEPLLLRVAIAIAWLLIVAGLVSSFI